MSAIKAGRTEIKGLTEMERRFSRLVQTAGRQLTDKGLRAAAKPIIIYARSKVRAVEQSGQLRKSLGTKLSKSRRHRNARVILIGPRTGFKIEFEGKPRNPVHYAHLVEFGTRHSRAHPFLRPAYQAEGTGPKAAKRYGDAVGPLIEQKAAQLGRKAGFL